MNLLFRLYIILHCMAAILGQTASIAGPTWISPAPPLGESFSNEVNFVEGSTIHLEWTVGNGGPYTLTLYVGDAPLTWTLATTTFDWQVSGITQYGFCDLFLYDGAHKSATTLFVNLVEGQAPTGSASDTGTSMTTGLEPPSSSGGSSANTGGGGGTTDKGTIIGATITAVCAVIAALIGACYVYRKRNRGAGGISDEHFALRKFSS